MLLERHYETIGIHDVFLSPPPHPLLSSYLSKEGCQESFSSWEIVGTIKKTPEDFIVREIFPSDRTIPGLDEKDVGKLRIASLLAAGERPLQNLKNDDRTQQQPPKVNNTHGLAGLQKAELGGTSTSDEATRAFLESYLQRITAGRKDMGQNLMSCLEQLQLGAKERIKKIASTSEKNSPTIEAEPVVLPPSTLEKTSESAMQEHREAHQALQRTFPLLRFDDTLKNETELWTLATIDNSYADLIPYLYCAEEDLGSLLLLQKIVERTTGTKLPLDSNKACNDQAILRLRPGIPKMERKQIFDLILSKCEMFATETLAEYPLPARESTDKNGSERTTVAIAVSTKRNMSPEAVLQAHVHHARITRNDAKTNLIANLETLQQVAEERICIVASGGSAVPTNTEANIVWIPPAATDSLSEAARRERGVLFQALKSKFPLLQPDGTIKNETERWIRVKIDDSYDSILPYLHCPVEDLRSLLVFQKQGIEGVKEKIKLKKETSKEQKIGHRDGRNTVDEANQVVLRLKPILSKEERRKIHNLIASNCKMFSTSTLTDYPLARSKENGDENVMATTRTTAVAVSWQTRALHSGRRKRKRNECNQSEATVESKYPNLLCVVKKRQKEHLGMVQRLTQAIRCRQAEIGIAGIKDMQAVTYQFCTIRNTKTHRVLSTMNQLEGNGIEIGNCFRVDWTLNNGDLGGNEFHIRIRDLKRICVRAVKAGPGQESMVRCETDHVMAMVHRIKQNGFINFFGPQRVGAPGESGATAFLIGKAMLQQKFQLAIDLLMMGREVFHREGEQEREPARRARRIWKETKDPSAALQALGSGDHMFRERTVLKGLNRYGKDQPLKALQCLSYSMRTFWINAYQSYVWNQVASKRSEKYGNHVVKGDLYVERDDIHLSNVQVVQDDRTVSSSISLDQIVLPLPGYRVRYPENDIGDLYQSILSHDGVKFEKSAPPEATAKGAYRRFIVHPGNIDAKIESAEGVDVKLRFQLPKGSYATMMLRELMITTASRNNG